MKPHIGRRILIVGDSNAGKSTLAEQLASAMGMPFVELDALHWLRADTIVWLDYPLRVTVPRIIRRSWRRWRSRELLWGTNRERMLDQLALWDEKKSLITFTVRLHRRRRVAFAAFMRDPRFSHVEFTRLERPATTRAWLVDVLAEHASVNS